MTSNDSDPNNDGSIAGKLLAKIFNKYKIKVTTNRNNDFDSYTSYGDLESSKQEMIKGIMGLSGKNVREIMIPRVDVAAVALNTSLKTLIKEIYNSGYSRLPVYKDTIDNIVGILHVKDLIKFIIERPKKFQLKKILHKPFFVPETMQLDDLLLEFKKKRFHLSIVVDEYGGVSGVITLETILDEIASEIKDELNNELIEMLKISKNAYRVDSRMTISNLNEEIGLSLPTDEFDTIGGFVFDLFGEVPKKDESIKYNDISFKIDNIKGTRINQIIITVPNNR